MDAGYGHSLLDQKGLQIFLATLLRMKTHGVKIRRIDNHHFATRRCQISFRLGDPFHGFRLHKEPFHASKLPS